MRLRWMLLWMLCLIFGVLPAFAQEDVDPELAKGAYQAALDMIRWAKEDHWDSLKFDDMRIETAETTWVQCWLTQLPPETAQLKDLRVLNLAECHMDTLPPEIGELTNLEELYL